MISALTVAYRSQDVSEGKEVQQSVTRRTHTRTTQHDGATTKHNNKGKSPVWHNKSRPDRQQ